MRRRVAGGAVGLVFGFTLVWSGMVSPEVIRSALLFEESYLFLFFGSAVGTAALGLAIVRRARMRALLTGAPVAWARETLDRRHVAGGALFGLGWGVTAVCPGPIAAQVGQGVGWSLLVLAGVLGGVALFQRQGRPETEPPAEPVAAPAPA